MNDETIIRYGFEPSAQALDVHSFGSSLQSQDCTGDTDFTSNFISVALRPAIQREAQPRRGGIASPIEDIHWNQVKPILDEAFDNISFAADQDNSQVERSNAFDSWASNLVELSCQSSFISLRHRTALGALIEAVRNKDYCNFYQSVIEGFVGITNILRQPTIQKIESKRIVSELLATTGGLALNLSPDQMSEDHMSMLDRMLIELIEKSKGMPND